MLSTNNVGTLLIVLAMITIKMYRDHGYRNNHIANMFKIELSALNKSEAAFLRIIDYSLLVSDEVFSHLFEEIFSFKYRKFLL
ncbi:hypothetical protein EZS27_016270 [termite gut metagenome]|uniref:Uncharacterized protein n=1 Tax=termite gut metagenome TaxID=433724 RepID=A0A5J4RNN3_9ZZZZ